MADPIEAAIAAAGQPQPIEMVQFQRNVASTGRPFVVLVPADVTDEEALAVCSFVATLPMHQRQQRGGPRILLPRPM